MTALMDETGVMYTSGMADNEIPEDVKVVEARNQLAAIIEKARYYDGITFLTNRGKRVAAIVPVADGERLLEERRTAES